MEEHTEITLQHNIEQPRYSTREQNSALFLFNLLTGNGSQVFEYGVQFDQNGLHFAVCLGVFLHCPCVFANFKFLYDGPHVEKNFGQLEDLEVNRFVVLSELTTRCPTKHRIRENFADQKKILLDVSVILGTEGLEHVENVFESVLPFERISVAQIFQSLLVENILELVVELIGCLRLVL